MSTLSFTTPWVLLVSLPAILLLWWWRMPHEGRDVRNSWALLCRMGTVLAVLVALASPMHVSPPAAVGLVVVRDVSASMDANARQQQAGIIAQLQQTQPSTALLGIVDVATDSLIAALPQPALRDTSQVLMTDTQATALADAVTLAASLVPGEYEARVLLLSDGNETRGRLQEISESMLARNVRVDVVPLTTQQLPPFLALTEVQLPQRIRGSGGMVATLLLQSARNQSAELVISDGSRELHRQPLTLSAGMQRQQVTIPALSPGIHRLTFRVYASADTLLDDNHQDVIVEQRGAPRILVLAHLVARVTPLVEAWQRIGVEVTVARPSEISTQLADFASHDVVVLFDTPARDVPLAVMRQIATNVTTLGKGFLWIGGADSFGAGGFRRTPLAEVAAVSLEPLDAKQRTQMDLLLVIDRSGSMSDGVAQLSMLDLAKEAAFRAIQNLQRGDTVGVAFFADSAAWALAPQPLPNDDVVAQALGSVQSDGGTSIASGLALAAAQAPTLRGDVRHVILLSDGMDPSPTDAIVQELRAQNVSLSTIALGPDADVATLQRLATLGNGTAYQVSDPQQLADVFLEDTTRVASRDIVEDVVTPRRVATDPWLAAFPTVQPVYGYNRTSAHPDTRVLMQIDELTPLWALRRVGRGQSMVWASDLGTRWGRDWTALPTLPAFAPLLLTPLLPADDRSLDVSWFWHDDILDIALSSGDAESPPDVALIDAQGRLIPVPLQARGVQQWSGQIRDIASGEYMIRATHDTATVVRGVILASRTELAPRDGNALLADIANRTGGRIMPRIDAAYWQSTTTSPTATRDLSVWFILGAMSLFVVEIALRRGIVAPQSLFQRRLRATPPASPPTTPPAAPPSPASPAPPTRFDRLRAAKARSRDPRESSE